MLQSAIILTVHKVGTFMIFSANLTSNYGNEEKKNKQNDQKIHSCEPQTRIGKYFNRGRHTAEPSGTVTQAECPLTVKNKSPLWLFTEGCCFFSDALWGCDNTHSGRSIERTSGGTGSFYRRAAPGLPKQLGTQKRHPLDWVNVGGQSAQSNKWSVETMPNDVTWQPTGPLPPLPPASPVLLPVIYAPVWATPEHYFHNLETLTQPSTHTYSHN